MLLDKL